MTDSTRPDAMIVWQGNDNSEKAAEPALLFARLDDGIIEIQQEDRYVIINIENVPEICKLLKELAK